MVIVLQSIFQFGVGGLGLRFYARQWRVASAYIVAYGD